MYEKYFNKLREECLIRNRSSRTADTYINNIRHFMKWTGYKPMEDLSLQDARLFILEKRNSGLSSATCNFYNSSICFLYKHVLHIPWDQDIVPRMRLDVKLPKVLSLEEIEKLINSATQIRNKAIIALLYSSGMRVGDDDDKIRLNQRKPSKYKGLRRFGPEKNLQRINKFMKERPIFYKNLIQMKENIRFYLRCFYCITKVMILQFNSENRTELARNG